MSGILGGLGVIVSTYDDDLRTAFSNLEGVIDRTRINGSTNLSTCHGKGNSLPIILLGHGNRANMKIGRGLGPADRIDAIGIYARLVEERKLDTSKFKFLFLCGCDGATDGLHVALAHGFRRPTLGLKGKVELNKLEDILHASPERAGVAWELYDPNGSRYYEGHDRMQECSDILRSIHVRLHHEPLGSDR